MSSSSAALTIHDYEITLVDNHCTVAVSALLFYEIIITCEQDVQFVWTSNARGFKAMFLLNRCIMVTFACGCILTIINFTTIPGVEAASIIPVSLTIISYATWPVFSALRVFAVTDRQWPLAILTFILGAVPVAANMSAEICTRYLNIDGVVAIFSDMPDVVESRLEIATRVCLMVSDAIVIIVTWFKTRHYVHKLAGRVSLARVLVTDGIVYFLILLILNIVSMILFFRQITLSFAALVTAITSIFIARLMLHLREACFSPEDPTGFYSRFETTLKFEGHLSSLDRLDDSQLGTGDGTTQILFEYGGSDMEDY